MSEAANELPESLLRSCPSWVSTMRAQHEDLSSTRQFPAVDIDKLNIQQKKAYTLFHHIILKQHGAITTTNDGAGDCWDWQVLPIRALAQMLTNKCLITQPLELALLSTTTSAVTQQ